MNKENIYALYKGDKFIDLGTKEYLAEKLNVTPKTIYYYTTAAYRKRIKDYSKRLFVIKIEDDHQEVV